MDAKKVASEILNKVGQKENVVSNATCMTRLRLTVADTSKVDVAGLKDVDSVLGVVEREQGVQIVLGPGKVTEVGREFAELTGIELGSVDEVDAADLAKENDIPAILAKFDEIVKKGFDPHIFIAGLGSHFRDLMLAQNPSTLALIEIGENTKAKYAEQSQKWTAQQLIDAIEICNHADINYKNSKNPRLTVEIALMQLASLTAVDMDKKKSS